MWCRGRCLIPIRLRTAGRMWTTTRGQVRGDDQTRRLRLRMPCTRVASRLGAVGEGGSIEEGMLQEMRVRLKERG